jgi:hypothetical protein
VPLGFPGNMMSIKAFWDLKRTWWFPHSWGHSSWLLTWASMDLATWCFKLLNSYMRILVKMLWENSRKTECWSCNRRTETLRAALGKGERSWRMFGFIWNYSFTQQVFIFSMCFLKGLGYPMRAPTFGNL